MYTWYDPCDGLVVAFAFAVLVAVAADPIGEEVGEALDPGNMGLVG